MICDRIIKLNHLMRDGFHPRMPLYYCTMKTLSVDMKFMPKGFEDFKYFANDYI